VARGDVRRAKLYYLRGRVGKRARVAERRWGIEDDLVITAEDDEAVDSEGVAQSEADAIPAQADGEEEEAEDTGKEGAAPEAQSSEESEATAEDSEEQKN